jgi:DNA-binding transcriptional MocR family regulator
MVSSERVLSLGSFSKILAPAMRLGWIQTSPNLLQKILANGFVNSGGCINHISAHIVQQAMDSGALARHVEVLKVAFRARLEAMHAALLEHFSDLASWTKPAGGYFFWLRFDETVDTAELRDKAQERETGLQNGAVFSTQGELHNYLRLSFAHYDEDDIRKGVQRLRTLF